LDRSEARRIARKAKSFALVDCELYKRAASGILQRCMPIPEGRELLRDITRAFAATMPHPAPSWVMRSAKASTGPTRSLTPARSCAPTRGASSTPVNLTSLRTPCM
jgi:hypothetical protein